MENASKALIMAASVLIGLLLITTGVILFNMFSTYSRNSQEKIEENAINQFNARFLKYYGDTVTTDVKNGSVQETTGPIKVTIHDIISLANLAKENNMNYEVDKENIDYTVSNPKRAGTSYVQVDVKIDGVGKNITKQLERKDEKTLNDFIYSYSNKKTSAGQTENKTRYFKCETAVISENTRRVVYIYFEEIL